MEAARPREATARRWAALAGLVVALLAWAPSAWAIVLPPSFDDQPVATTTDPTALAFTPDGRMLIATKPGPLRVYEGGSLVPAPAIDLTGVVCSDSERGLLGVAVDPSFQSNHFIYLYYTFRKHGTCEVNTATTPVNRVSRFVLGPDNLIAPSSELVLIDNIPSKDGIHNAGDLHFGKDGFLYAATGDGGCDWRGDSGCYLLNDASRDLGGLAGKILRITRDGAIPPGNPYSGGNTARCNVTGSTSANRRCQEIYASGLRNPFRTAFDVNSPTTRFYINDVGNSLWEEIDVGQAGADYGWNVREGPCASNSTTNCGPPPAGMTNPIYSYQHANNCSSITLGDFVPVGVWPPQYDGAYLFGDVVCGKIWQLVPQGGGYTASEFASGIVSLIDGVFGPSGADQALYYITWAVYPDHEVRRITYTGQANRAPTARLNADPTYGNLPLAVDFDGTASSDPDDDGLTYEWSFGDDSPTATGATTSHTYTTEGTYTATLTVRDGRGGEHSATQRIDAGNNPPAVTIDSPAPTYLFRVGEELVLSASASDPEDGPLSDSALSWRVERHHDTHTHPYLPLTQGNGIPITGPEPEDLLAATNSYLELIVTATDSRGLSRTISQDLDPRLVDLTFLTSPTGFRVEAAGTTLTAPVTVTSWENWTLTVNAPDQADGAGAPWLFSSWSDGGARSHAITTPAAPASYAATFERLEYPRPGGATPLRVPLVPAFAQCTNPNSSHFPPLANGSCSPPELESAQLTTSSTGRGSGFGRWEVIRGDPGTPADEADLAISATAIDVRRAADGVDYTGEVILTSNLRITDRANGSSALLPATVSDLGLSAPFNCVATPASSLGSSCSITTTADTLVPGLAQEGKRAVTSAFGLVLEDAGPDGSVTSPSGDCPPTCGSGDEKPFLRQGVFTP